MNKGLKWLIWIVIVALVVWGLTNKKGGEGSKTSSNGSDTIKVGVIAPLTGDGAVYGEPAVNVYKIAVDEINNNGGIKGKKLELIVEDAKCSADDAVSAVRKLVTTAKPAVILGGLCSSESLAAAPILTAEKVVLFSPGSSNPGLTNISPFFFRNYPSDSSQGKVLAQAAFNDKGWKKVAFLQEQTDYTRGIFNSFSEEFKKLGGTVIEESLSPQSNDFRSQITKIKNAQVDAVFINPQTPAFSQRLFQQMKQLKYQPKMILNDIATDADVLKNWGDFIDNSLTAIFAIDPQNPKLKALKDKYKSIYNIDVPFEAYAQTEYDAIYMVRDALLAVGNDGEKIAQWSRTVKDWEGASGKVTILPSGDRDGGHTVKMIKGGKVVDYVK